MITITIPYPGDPEFDQRHGPSRWREDLTDAHYVWEAYGYSLRNLAGMKSADAALIVQALIADVLADPDAVHGASYYDLRATVADLTGLFFTLRERPEGTVQVS